jgi:hypothetical protein
MSSPIIQIVDLGEAYRLGQEDVQQATLREALVNVIKAPARWWRERCASPATRKSNSGRSEWLGDQMGDWHIEPDAVSFNIVERDIWGLGKLPPTYGTSLW